MSKTGPTTWFVSDLHWGHSNVIDFCDRPFKDIQEMEDKIRENWNSVVSPEDLVIVAGDCFFYSSREKMKQILSDLNGRKTLVIGNHDRKPNQMINAGFDFCVQEMTILIAKERVVISHFPYAMPEWKYQLIKAIGNIKKFLGFKKIRWPEKYHSRRPIDRGGFLLHGHTHDKNKIKNRQIHVGVDAWDFRPVNIQEISNIICNIKK